MYNILMKQQLKALIKSMHRRLRSTTVTTQPLITITLSRSALLNNLNEFRKLAPGGQVAPVLKSNAYGHGQDLIARLLENEKVPFIVIDSYFEAQAIRNNGIRTPLLIIGYSTPESIATNNLKDTSFTITSLDTLKSLLPLLKNASGKIKIHLKIDTGMHRQGILPNEQNEVTEIIKKSPNLILDGICSHFADADSDDPAYTQKQISVWNDSVSYFRQQFPSLTYWHISATSGHIHKGAEANLSRLGIGLYGLTNITGLNLKPILEMSTIITGTKRIHNGDQIGYGGTFVAPNDMTIATIPVGYYEGVDRRLSNIGTVILDKIECPIIGRVSMNVTTIDVSGIKNAKIGDKVIVISRNKTDKNSIENIAKLCGIISYEIAVYIPSQLKRVIVD